MNFREAAHQVGHWVKGVAGYAAATSVVEFGVGVLTGFMKDTAAPYTTVGLLFAVTAGTISGVGRMFGEEAGAKTTFALAGGTLGAALGGFTPASFFMASAGAWAGWRTKKNQIEDRKQQQAEAANYDQILSEIPDAERKLLFKMMDAHRRVPL